MRLKRYNKILQKRIAIYRALYITYAFLRFDVLKPSSHFGQAIAIISLILNFIITKDFKWTAALTTSFYILIIVLTYFLWEVIQRYFKNIGTTEKFDFKGNHFVRSNNGDPCELLLDGIDPERFEFATVKTAQIAAELNANAFSRWSLWAGGMDEKFDRNIGHIKKNSLSIMFVKSRSGEKYLGYTHILPLTKGSWDWYLKAKISDSKLTHDFIVSEDHSNLKDYKKPYGLLIFSVASVYYDDEFNNSENFRNDIGNLYEQAAVYHVGRYLETQFTGNKKVPIMFQNMGREVLKFFKDCATSDQSLSRDRIRIITFEVANE